MICIKKASKLGAGAAKRWSHVLTEEKVNVWYTSPTAIRMLMRFGSETFKRRTYPNLRFAACAGEPLAPDAIMTANFAAMDIKPGSMGKPLPGVEVGVAEYRPDGHLTFVEDPDCVGELVLRSGNSQRKDYVARSQK